jgi:hypothetical protein
MFQVRLTAGQRPLKARIEVRILDLEPVLEYDKENIMAKAVKHIGFKAAQKKIAKKSGVSSESAAKILASSARKASSKAVKANPRLKKVPGVKKGE